VDPLVDRGDEAPSWTRVPGPRTGHEMRQLSRMLEQRCQRNLIQKALAFID